MSVFLAKGRMRVDHGGVDPREKLLAELGDISGIEIFYNYVLVAVYTIPKEAKTAGGLLIPQKTADESIWQGRACLVAKLGPQAFKDEGEVKFWGCKADVGDWVLTRAADGQSLEINGVICRLYRDTQIMAKLADPDSVW
jgi:co-chaperonin GroES (HSP10)